jgi:hypothetical protein
LVELAKFFYVLYCYVQVQIAHPRLLLCCKSLWQSIIKNFRTCIPGHLSFPKCTILSIYQSRCCTTTTKTPLEHAFGGQKRVIQTQKWQQFVSISLTLATYHQVYMAYTQIGSHDDHDERPQNYLYSGDTVNVGELTCIEDRFSASIILQISHAVVHTVSTN